MEPSWTWPHTDNELDIPSAVKPSSRKTRSEFGRRFHSTGKLHGTFDDRVRVVEGR